MYQYCIVFKNRCENKTVTMADEITPVLEFPDWHENPVGGDPFTQDLGASYDKACCVFFPANTEQEIRQEVPPN